MRHVWLIALLAALLWLPACGEENSDDEEIPTGELTLYEGFDSVDLVKEHKGILRDEDDLTAFVPGILGAGYWLGDGNYILFPGQENINPEHGTLEFWMLIKDNWHDGSERHILHLNGPQNFAIYKEPLTDYLAFSVNGKSVYRPEHGQFIGWNAFPQWGARWTHVAVTWRNLVDEDDEDARLDGELVLYVDGVVINQLVGRIAKIDVNNSLMIGAWESGHEANVIIDELHIYSRAKSWDEFQTYDRGYPDTEMPYPLLVWPTTHEPGLRPEDGFHIDLDTKIIVGDEDYSRLEDALQLLREELLWTVGFAPDIGPASRFYGTDNYIAIGEPTKNGLVATIAEKRKLPVQRDNPGPGGYLLEVYSEGIVVAGSDFAGTVHGLMSLIQIVRQHEEGYIPAISLVDYPNFSVRAAEWFTTGLLLDDEAKRRIRFFGSLKLSHLLIRTPDYLKLDEDDVRQRVTDFFAFVKRYGIEAVPLIDLLSHAEFVNAICWEDGVDCTENGDLNTYCPCEPYVYDEVVDPALRNVIRILQPSIVHIGHDDVKTLAADARCVATQLSPAELFAQDVNHAYDLLRRLDPKVQVWMWADMLNPLHNGGRLKQPAPYEGAPDPPPIITLLPNTLVYNLWYYAPVDVVTYILALLSLRGFEEGLLPYYTAGPVGDDVPGAMMWMRNAYDMNAVGYVFRPRTNPEGPGDLSDPGWNGLAAANELAWSMFVPQDINDVWYDYATTTQSYGGF